jgi:hypothetical protein
MGSPRTYAPSSLGDALVFTPSGAVGRSADGKPLRSSVRESPIVRCPNLMGKLIEVYVISNDDVPVGVVDEVVVAQHISFSGIALGPRDRPCDTPCEPRRVMSRRTRTQIQMTHSEARCSQHPTYQKSGMVEDNFRKTISQALRGAGSSSASRCNGGIRVSIWQGGRLRGV